MIYSNSELKIKVLGILQSLIKNLGLIPRPLQIIQLGDNIVSSRYVNLKLKMAKELGIKTHLIQPDVVDFEQVKDFFDRLPEMISKELINEASWQAGVMLQLPFDFQEQIDYPALWDNDNFVDIDFLGYQTSRLFARGFLPPTIQAIDLVLKDILLNLNDFTLIEFQIKLDLRGKIVAAVGQGQLVGKFLTQYLVERGATVISINEQTPNPELLCKQADIVITATGVGGLIKSNWLSSGAIVIDAGTSDSNGSIAGDVDITQLTATHKIDEIVLCKSPGGIGPLTILCLFYNLIMIG